MMAVTCVSLRTHFFITVLILSNFSEDTYV